MDRLKNRPEVLKSAIANRLKGKFYALQHAQLSALPVNEIVTTNYDELFEMASRSSKCH